MLSKVIFAFFALSIGLVAAVPAAAAAQGLTVAKGINVSKIKPITVDVKSLPSNKLVEGTGPSNASVNDGLHHLKARAAPAGWNDYLVTCTGKIRLSTKKYNTKT